jgi:uncharacterized membrane protein
MTQKVDGVTGEMKSNRRPLIAAGTMIGIGMGGFVDGIVLHQILQVHNMMSARLPPTTLVNMEINMVWDGLFHAFCWIATAVGLAMLFRAGRQADVPWSGKTLTGSLILGWGIFNIVEGVIDHHVLHVHHVVERLGVSVWDWAFLGIGGVGLIVVGLAIIAAGRGDGSAGRPTTTY